MDVVRFVSILKTANVRFFTGVPDSQLKPMCDYLVSTYGISDEHVIAANEGNAVALAAGYHLSTGCVPCVYLQNSGLGNIANPVLSLLSDRVYGIPCVFVVGWRGAPGVKDEPQHAFQGEVTLELLDLMEVQYMVVDEGTTEEDVRQKMAIFRDLLQLDKSVAFVVKKGALTYHSAVKYRNNNLLSREKVISVVVDAANADVIVSTTGKTSRELFEIREHRSHSHEQDFLTVGSMGHSSSIALGVALSRPATRVWCIDGDGAALMHMGAMAVIGQNAPSNFVHVLINNGAHESVGGQPTVAQGVDFCAIAEACGYQQTYHVIDLDGLNDVVEQVQRRPGPILIEVASSIGSRDDLSRPTITPIDNKRSFMAYLKDEPK